MSPASVTTPALSVWRFAGRAFEFHRPPESRPLLMGIVNTTPDSFSDGGQFLAPESAVDHALRLIDEGADIIDVGGQSTRPGSDAVSLDVELSRVLPVIESLRQRRDVLISVDTSKAEVARRALVVGAQIINDVTALREDPAMIQVAAAGDAGLIIMHMLGTPKTMQTDPRYADVVYDVRGLLAERLAWLSTNRVSPDRVVIDPGLGFGKALEHNLRLIRDLNGLADLGRPICLGPSRKSFIGQVLNRPVDQRVVGTAAACLAGYLRGANILRVHDVASVHDAVTMTRTILGS